VVHYMLLSRAMAIYRLIKPLAAFAPREERAFTIPAGSLLEKDILIEAFDLTSVEWAGGMVLVPIQDLIERSEPLG
jgi:hypothetical protein